MQIPIVINKRRFSKKLYLLIFIAVAALIITACTSSITIISQQDHVTPGDTAHMTIRVDWTLINYDRNDRQIIGICVPKSFNAAQNATITYSGDPGKGRFVLIPEGIVDPATKQPYAQAFAKKFGFGPNYINDMEWVAYWSDVKFAVANQTSPGGEIYINVKTGPEYLSFRPGFAMCEDEDGLSDANSGYYTSLFGTCMEVVGSGTDDILDFCNPQIGVADPSNSTENDIITIKYNQSLDTSMLKNQQEIYFCAKAFTNTGDSITVCQQNAASKLTKSGLSEYRIDFWPKKLFNLPAGKTLTRLEYYFTDKSGVVKTGYGNTADPFKYRFKCK